MINLDSIRNRASLTCTEVVLKNTLQATYWIIPTGGHPIHWDYPIGNIEITLCIPWFLRG